MVASGDDVGGGAGAAVVGTLRSTAWSSQAVEPSTPSARSWRPSARRTVRVSPSATESRDPSSPRAARIASRSRASVARPPSPNRVGSARYQARSPERSSSGQARPSTRVTVPVTRSTDTYGVVTASPVSSGATRTRSTTSTTAEPSSSVGGGASQVTSTIERDVGSSGRGASPRVGPGPSSTGTAVAPAGPGSPSAAPGAARVEEGTSPAGPVPSTAACGYQAEATTDSSAVPSPSTASVHMAPPPGTSSRGTSSSTRPLGWNEASPDDSVVNDVPSPTCTAPEVVPPRLRSETRSRSPAGSPNETEARHGSSGSSKGPANRRATTGRSGSRPGVT